MQYKERYALAEKLAELRVKDMSREELENYAFGYMMDYWMDANDEELAEALKEVEENV